MKLRILLAPAMILLLAADDPKKPEIPELNRKVLEYARDNLGKKIGDGECATLAARALHKAEARRWSISRPGEYVWGKLVRTVTADTNLTGDVLPGDILQFREAVFAGKAGKNTFEFTYPLHTAIVEAVKDDGKVIEVLHQNAGDFAAPDTERRKVQRTTMRFVELKKGSVKIYRPLPRTDGDG
jgi:hypothetical protein